MTVFIVIETMMVDAVYPTLLGVYRKQKDALDVAWNHVIKLEESADTYLPHQTTHALPTIALWANEERTITVSVERHDINDGPRSFTAATKKQGKLDTQFVSNVLAQAVKDDDVTMHFFDVGGELLDILPAKFHKRDDWMGVYVAMCYNVIADVARIDIRNHNELMVSYMPEPRKSFSPGSEISFTVERGKP